MGIPTAPCRLPTLGPVSRPSVCSYISDVATQRNPALARERKGQLEKRREIRACDIFIAMETQKEREEDEDEDEEEEEDEELVVVERPDSNEWEVSGVAECTARNGEGNGWGKWA
jgi:hypothetical protein